MNWNEIDWASLEALRENFLSENPAKTENYWNSLKTLESYDLTFAQRIGWKWDAVFKEVKEKGYSPTKTVLFDWGCGTGIASRKFLEYWPASVESVLLFDRSREASEFAKSKISLARVSIWSEKDPLPP